MSEAGRSHLARAILEYLWKHPDAQDTVAGISQWWLSEESLSSPDTIIKDALADLVAAGLILEREGKDSQIHYSINRRTLQRVRAFLKREGKRPGHSQ